MINRRTEHRLNNKEKRKMILFRMMLKEEIENHLRKINLTNMMSQIKRKQIK